MSWALALLCKATDIIDWDKGWKFELNQKIVTLTMFYPYFGKGLVFIKVSFTSVFYVLILWSLMSNKSVANPLGSETVW